MFDLPMTQVAFMQIAFKTYLNNVHIYKLHLATKLKMNLFETAD